MTSPATTEQKATPDERKPLDLVIVPATADALPYVLSTWGRSIEDNLEGKPQLGFLKAFAQIQARIIRRSQVLVAKSAERIVGFAIFEPPKADSAGMLHWICTRKELRGNGVASSLLGAAQLTGHQPVITAWTSSLRYLRLADAPYSPFWLRI